MPERAGDIFALFSSVATYRQLFDGYGWSLDECETWMVETVRALLLRETGA